MPVSTVCPICHNPIDPAVRQLLHQPEPHVVLELQAHHPEWSPDDGACPECVFRAVQRTHDAESVQSLQAELHLPFPAYAPDNTRLLPTPARVAVNPKYTGKGIMIAFLDSGFYPHPDLTKPANRIVAYCDATANEPEERHSTGKVTVMSWHGLMTTCVGVGNGFMSAGRYRGIAYRANVVLVKTGNRRNPRHISERDIGRALRWVIANRERFNIRIVNISLGGDYESTGKLTDLDAKVEQAVAAGVTVICAAGNSGERGIIPPASAPSAITVGGVDDGNSLNRARHKLYWSSYGAGAHGARKPEVIAPALWLSAPMLPKTSTHNEAQYLWKLEALSDRQLEKELNTTYAQKRFSKKTLGLSLDEIRAAIRERIVEHKFIHPHY
ncbi:MAG: S8 family serine peptidase, partial [Anaerolineales bacterium]